MREAWWWWVHCYVGGPLYFPLWAAGKVWPACGRLGSRLYRGTLPVRETMSQLPEEKTVLLKYLDCEGNPRETRAVPLNLSFVLPEGKRTPEWRLLAYDLNSETALSLPMERVFLWRAGG